MLFSGRPQVIPGPVFLHLQGITGTGENCRIVPNCSNVISDRKGIREPGLGVKLGSIMFLSRSLDLVLGADTPRQDCGSQRQDFSPFTGAK